MVSSKIVYVAKGNDDGDARAVWLARHDRESVRVAIELAQLNPRARQPHALDDARARAKAAAIIRHGDDHFVALPSRGHVDDSATFGQAQTMKDRVLDQRLQQHRRNRRVEHLAIGVDTDRQTIAIADLFDGRVVDDEVDFLPEGHFMRADVVEHQTQQIAEPIEHQLGRLDILAHHRGDRMQGVEEEMRLQLGLHQQQFGLCKLLLALPISIEIVDRLGEADDRPIRQQIRMEPHE